MQGSRYNYDHLPKIDEESSIHEDSIILENPNGSYSIQSPQPKNLNISELESETNSMYLSDISSIIDSSNPRSSDELISMTRKMNTSL